MSIQARNITNISKTNDPFLQQIQKVLLKLRIREETSFYWPKEIYSYFLIYFWKKLQILLQNLATL